MAAEFARLGQCLVLVAMMLAAASAGAIPSGTAAVQQAPLLPPEAPADGDIAEPEALSVPLGLQAQLWWQQFEHRSGGEEKRFDYLRSVLDWRREWMLSATTRLAVSNRYEHIVELDAGSEGPPFDRNNNMLRELWISWRTGGAARPIYLDVGRINQRGGTASGYNPADFFKPGSVVSATSLDPGALRSNRLGTAMVRGLLITEHGSLAIAIVPKLSSSPSIDGVRDSSGFSLDLDRTNAREAIWLRLAPQSGERISVDLLGFARSGEKPQFGANLSALLGNSLVGNVEWSGARRPGLAGPGEPELPAAWRNRVAANLTWTFASGVEVTLERSYAGDALSREDWRAWRAAADSHHGIELGTLFERRSWLQEPLVRDGWFARTSWRDAWGRRGLDVSSFVLVNPYDSSALWQLSMTNALSERWSVSGLLGRYLGGHDTEFGGARTRSYFSLNITRHL